MSTLAGLAGAGPALAVEPATARPLTLITGGTVVTMDATDRVLADGAVAVRDGAIEAVGTTAELLARYPDARRVDATGRAVLPGLVNTHTHAPMTLFRGLADDLALMEWLQEHIFPAEAKNVDEDFVRWGTRLACLEMLSGGTTTFADMYYFEDAIAEEVDRCGMRAVLGETVIDFPVPDNKTWAAAMAYTERFLARWHGNGRVIAAVAPHAPYTVSAAHLQEAARLAEKYQAPYVVHVAETEVEVAGIAKDHGGLTPVAYLDSLGVLGPRVLAAHMVWPTAADIQTLAQRHVGVAHCPQSNMKLASGVAPVPDLQAAGVAVGLGTDGPASNNDLDLWEEMDTAAKLHKLWRKDPTALSARTALRMATIEGARAMGLGDRIGSLEVGKRADLLIVDLGSPHQQPVYDVVSTLAYATKASDVELVMVDGHVVVEGGKVLTVDAPAVLAKAAVYRDRVRASLARP
jgi:5-methylthioadenosine/S-adenosylhomocysteine deaminase